MAIDRAELASRLPPAAPAQAASSARARARAAAGGGHGRSIAGTKGILCVGPTLFCVTLHA